MCTEWSIRQFEGWWSRISEWTGGDRFAKKREQMNREVTSQLYQRGLSALQSEDMFSAISAFSTVLSQFPDDKASLFFLTEASDKLRES